MDKINVLKEALDRFEKIDFLKGIMGPMQYAENEKAIISLKDCILNIDKEVENDDPLFYMEEIELPEYRESVEVINDNLKLILKNIIAVLLKFEGVIKSPELLCYEDSSTYDKSAEKSNELFELKVKLHLIQIAIIITSVFDEQGDDQVLNQIGYANHLIGEYKFALKFYNQSIANNFLLNPDAYFRRGIINYFILNDDSAVLDFQTAIAHGNKEAKALYKMIDENYGFYPFT